MCKRFVPHYYASSIYEVPIDFYSQRGYRKLVLDLDNTLDSFRAKVPSERALHLVRSLQKAGYMVIIVSNNTEKRVAPYAAVLGVKFLSSARKPFGYKFKKFFRTEGIDPRETLLIGDQLLTDVLASKNAGISVLLTEKIVKEDQWTTKINRLFDRPIRALLRRKDRLPCWRKFYE
ncbi:MAG: YqeG family HAD IIIA-type phosphatase [Bacilli bacterium]|jgi:HAD superfamily phosphatase (TIGR01668 family)